MACINRFPGYCTDCAAYVAAGAGVYVKATIRTYCAEAAPDDSFTRLVAESRTVASPPCGDPPNWLRKPVAVDRPARYGRTALVLGRRRPFLLESAHRGPYRPTRSFAAADRNAALTGLEVDVAQETDVETIDAPLQPDEEELVKILDEPPEGRRSREDDLVADESSSPPAKDSEYFTAPAVDANDNEMRS